MLVDCEVGTVFDPSSVLLYKHFGFINIDGFVIFVLLSLGACCLCFVLLGTISFRSTLSAYANSSLSSLRTLCIPTHFNLRVQILRNCFL